MADRSVALRLATTGKADVKRDFAEIADAGDATAKRYQKAYEAAGDEIDRQMQRQAQAQAKLAAIAPVTPTQQIYQAGASSNYGGASARESAASFRELLAAEDALDGKAAALIATLEPLRVAQERYNGEVRIATELHDTGRISLEQFLAAEQRAALGLEKVAGTARDANTAMHAASTAKTYQAAPDTAFVGKSAANSAAAIEELMAAEERLTARSNALRASIDPAWVAQQRFNDQMGEARSLISQNAISLDQYCEKLRIETATLKEAESAGNSVAAGHGRMSTSAQILQHVVRSTTDSFAAGLPPAMILAEQIGRLGEAAAYAGGEAGGKGKLAALGAFMGGPWGIAFTAAISVAGALAPKLLEGADAADVMKEHQQALAAIIDQTTGRINEQSKALLLNAAAMSQKDAKAAQSAAEEAKRNILAAGRATQVGGATAGIGGAMSVPDPRVRSAIDAFAKDGSADKLAARLAAIGRASPDLKVVTDQIIEQGAAFVTADRQAQQYQAQVRLTTGQAKPGDQRKALGQFGPEKPDLSLVDAQAKLAAATTKSERAEAQATITRITAKKAYDDGSISIDEYKAQMVAADKAVSSAKEHTDKHAQSLARQAESMEVSARGAIDVANAYLRSSDAGLLAEARRKAATDATRKGISVDEQAARQLALAAAEQIANAAKSVAAMGEESDARDAILAKVKDGTIAASDMDEALKVELALRPLLAARAHVHGDALDALNKTIDATTAALERSTIAAGKFDIGKQIETSRQNLLELGAQVEDLAHTPEDAARNAAARAAARAADLAKLPVNDPQRMDLYHAKVDEASAGVKLKSATFFQTTLDGQKDALALSQRELELAGANDNYRTTELDKLKLSLSIRRQFPEADQASVAAVLQGVVAQDEINARLKITAAGIAEVRQFGGQFVDDVLSTETWSSWGNAAKTVTKDIENEFIKLTLLNPIKNMLNGNSDLPTLGSALGSLFGKASSLTSSINSMTSSTLDSANAAFAASLPSLGHNASGTQNWSGGMTWVNENGPEIADLPNGTRIYPAAESRRMMQAANDVGTAGGVTHNHFTGNLLTPEWWAQIQAGDDGAAARGAAGGAAIGQAQTAAAGKRKLGRNW